MRLAITRRWSLLLAIVAICSLSVRLAEHIHNELAWEELTGSGKFLISVAGEPVVVRFGSHAGRFCGCRSNSKSCCRLLVIRPNDPQATNPLLSFSGPCDADVLDLMSWEVTKVWVERPVPGTPQRFKTYDINHEHRYWAWNGETYTSTPAGFW